MVAEHFQPIRRASAVPVACVPKKGGRIALSTLGERSTLVEPRLPSSGPQWDKLGARGFDPARR